MNTIDFHDRPNLILQTDSYKISHHNLYPPKTTKIYSYFESRGGEFDYTVFFGLQYIIKKYLEGWAISQENINEADDILKKHLGSGVFNKFAWQYILDKYGGRLPISIKAVPEGSVVPTRNVLMTVENTDPECYWLTNYLETLLVQAWYSCTVATQSHWMKQRLLHYLELNGTPESIDFKLHDFGYRGVSSHETAGIGAAAHLINFKGTDTMAGLIVARDYYNADVVGHSIPATEHSTITSWGKENESAAYENMLDKYPSGIIACVSDSYNIFTACDEIWGTELRDKVLNRDGVLVVRPDSGDPLEVLPKLLNILGDKFGYTYNAKEYRVLNDKVRLIQGDGVDRNTMCEILDLLHNQKWSADNITFGSGGGLLQKLNRDTCKFAFKCSEAIVDNQAVPVYKEPVGQSDKKSKRGRLTLHRTCCGYETMDDTKRNLLGVFAPDPEQDQLVEVFRDGKLLVDQTFDDIRSRANENALNLEPV